MSIELTTLNPWRPADWRWQRASLLASGELKRNRKHDDRYVQYLERFARAVLAEDADTTREQLAEHNPALFWAYELYRQDDPARRAEVEARIIGNQQPYAIAARTGIHESIIKEYERAFYDVRDKLQFKSYVLHTLVGTAMHRGIQERDYPLAWKYLSFTFGVDLFDAYMAQAIGPSKPRDAASIRACYADMGFMSLVRKHAMAATGIPLNQFTQVNVMEIYAKYMELDRQSGQAAATGSNTIIQNIQSILNLLPLDIGPFAKPKVDGPAMARYDSSAEELSTPRLLLAGRGELQDDEPQNLVYPEIMNHAAGLTPETEQAVTQALDQVTDLVEAGEHPTAAVLKAAADNSLAPGHARLLAVAYNTGRAAFQRETGDDTNQKIAEFDLADPELVANELARTQKVAASHRESSEVSSAYSQPPSFIRAAYKRATAEIEIPPMCDKPAGELPAAQTTTAIDACSTVRSLQRKVSDVRMIADKMVRQLSTALDSVEDDFRVLGGPTLSTMRKAAEAKADKAVLAILAEIERRTPYLAKQAASQSVLLTGAEQSLYSKLATCGEQAQEIVMAYKYLDRLVTQVDHQIDAVTAPYMLKASAADDPFFELNEAAPKQAGFTQDGVRRVGIPFLGAAMGAGKASGSDTMNENVKAYQLALEDPQHDQQMRGLRARTTLEQLRGLDPVLSGYPQEELVNAFNRLSQAAPDAASQPLYAQAMLARYLGQGGHMEPDDVRSNVLAPNKDMVQSRLQGLPELPQTGRYKHDGLRLNSVKQPLESLQRARHAIRETFARQFDGEPTQETPQDPPRTPPKPPEKQPGTP